MIKADEVGANAAEGDPGGVDDLARRDGVAFDARHLDQTFDGIAGKTEAVVHRDLGGILDLFGCAAEDFGSVRAIVATRGGKGAYRIADQLDFIAARNDPKS